MSFHQHSAESGSTAGSESLDAILEGDPTGDYAAMDEATREQYRRACREVAATSSRAPAEVAREALRLSGAHDAREPRGRHVGTWLLAEGRPRLEAALGCRRPWRTRVSRWLGRHSQGAYVGALVALTVLPLLGVEAWLAARGMGVLHRLLLEALLVLPVLDFFQEHVDSIIFRFVARREPLPRLDPARVFSPDTRTLVVTPLLVASTEDIDSQLRTLEINHQGNTAPELTFVLLTDFRDAPEKDMPPDGALRERLERGVRELNERHGYRDRPRFFCLHRERRWNPVARRWMGWERKRGKLEELNRLVLGATDTSYTGPVPEAVRTARYVLTLDADTHLLPGAAARLVSMLHHPLNRARFDATGTRVVAGYSMLQPAISEGPTRAQWMASGGWPLSIVRQEKIFRPSPDLQRVYQALFGVGYSIGKGLYDVAAFTRALEGRLPENMILSHDKIEGMFARIGYAQDVPLLEHSPVAMANHARIWHRWIRGDWQLLPWVFPKVPSQHGRVSNTLPLIARWTLLAAVRGSLNSPCKLLLFLYGWLVLPARHAELWTLALSLWLCLPTLLSGMKNTLRAAWGFGSVLSGLRFTLVAIPRFVLQSTVSLAILLPVTGLVLDACGRALYGLLFDRSRMLDWTTHAQSSREARSVRHLLRLPEVGGALVLSLGIAGALALHNPGALPWAAPLLLVWVPLPVAHLLRREATPAAVQTAPGLEPLRTLARGSWALYEQGVRTGGATEFSPTDLALVLVAPLSAYHLGCLELEALVSRLAESLEVFSGLERHRGHLLERYDVEQRRPKGPRRVSTAESGVLAAALVIIERGLHASREACTDAGWVARLAAVEARARALREEMDFSFLYDEGAGLLHVGHDVESGALEAAHHGLLTSGAMLAGFVAIAQHQVPLEHWTALTASDQRLRAAGAVALGNDVAEQLLPTLFLWYPPATLLAQAALATVEAGLDAPDLTPPAWRFRPERALAELQRMSSPEVRPPRTLALALAAAANLTCDDVLVRHFHQHWRTAWVEALVYETRDTP